jgi:hypothetical protein
MMSILFSPFFLGLRVSVGVPGKLQPPQPRHILVRFVGRQRGAAFVDETGPDQT